jgi:hypothetical protein
MQAKNNTPKTRPSAMMQEHCSPLRELLREAVRVRRSLSGAPDASKPQSPYEQVCFHTNFMDKLRVPCKARIHVRYQLTCSFHTDNTSTNKQNRMARDASTGSRQAGAHQTAMGEGLLIESADPQSSARQNVALELMRQRHLNEDLSAKLDALLSSNKVP